jgi:hypothetical protein
MYTGPPLLVIIGLIVGQAHKTLRGRSYTSVTGWTQTFGTGSVNQFKSATFHIVKQLYYIINVIVDLLYGLYDLIIPHKYL